MWLRMGQEKSGRDVLVPRTKPTNPSLQIGTVSERGKIAVSRKKTGVKDSLVDEKERGGGGGVKKPHG